MQFEVVEKMENNNTHSFKGVRELRGWNIQVFHKGRVQRVFLHFIIFSQIKVSHKIKCTCVLQDPGREKMTLVPMSYSYEDEFVFGSFLHAYLVLGTLLVGVLTP